MQHGNVFTYVSKKLKKHKLKYPTQNLELTAVVFILKIWRHYLYNASCLIFPNHKSLRYLLM